MEFTFYGHPNITAKHRTTMEITKDDNVTKEGDCIIGVKADFSPEELRGLTGRQMLIISSGQHEEHIRFLANPAFMDEREIVIRLGSFMSPRTLGTDADKAAHDLRMRELFKAPKTKFNARIIPCEGN
jgi:uncharacterized protein